MKIMRKLKNFIKNIFTDKELSSENRLDFLDGYRATLAITVMIVHGRKDENCEIVNLSFGYSQTYSISGFFMLSAFLLTYRLLNELNKTSDLKIFPLIILKYLIRRYARVYLYYVAFYAVAKYASKLNITMASANESILQVALLGYPGKTHLWTFPAELKYYLVIPVFCLIARLLNRLQIMMLVVSILWSVWDQIFNFFSLSSEYSSYKSPTVYELKAHFAVFFLGSQVGLAFFMVEKNEKISKLFQIKNVKMATNYLSLAIALAGLKLNAFVAVDSYHYRSRPAIFWSSALFLTLVGQPNMISNYFSGTSFLKNLGRYSFSFYLFHVLVGFIVQSVKHFVYQFEFLLILLFVNYHASRVIFRLIEMPLIDLANYLCKRLDERWPYKRAEIRIEFQVEQVLVKSTDSNEQI